MFMLHSWFCISAFCIIDHSYKGISNMLGNTTATPGLLSTFDYATMRGIQKSVVWVCVHVRERERTN